MSIKQCFENAFLNRAEEAIAEIEKVPEYIEARQNLEESLRQLPDDLRSRMVINVQKMIVVSIRKSSTIGFWEGAGMLEYLQKCAACVARSWE